jgi:putative transposase
MSRGNRKQQVFIETDDYRKYLSLMRKYKYKYPTRIYAYCLMPNHVHLMLDPEKCNTLARFMHGVNTSYSKWFNEKYEKIGHLWQDRYKSYVIQKDDYLIDCLNYIEYNPVRSKIALRPNEYSWSSYQARILGEKGEDKILNAIPL